MRKFSTRSNFITKRTFQDGKRLVEAQRSGKFIDVIAVNRQETEEGRFQ